MKNKLVNLAFIIISIIFFIYPTSFGITAIGVITFLLLFGLLLNVYKKIHFRIPQKYYIFIITILAIITRIGVVFILRQVVQVSDFSMAFNTAKNLKYSGDYYLVFTHWILYPKIVNALFNLFGKKQLVALLFNASILIITCLVIYVLASLMMSNKKHGFYASLVYILWPANIMYTIIFTPEHLGALLLLLSLTLFVLIDKKDYRFIKKLFLAGLVGILLGFSTFFKNFALVFIIAFTFYFFIKSFMDKTNKSVFIKRIVELVVIIGCFIATKSVTFMYIDSLVGQKVNRSIELCYLNVGLRGNGTYNAEYYQMYFDAIKDSNYDYTLANMKIAKELVKYLKNSESELYNVDFFWNKATVISQNDSGRFYFINQSLPNSNPKLMVLLEMINNYYFSVLVFLMAFSLFGIYYEKKLDIFLVYLIIYGSFLLLLLVEAQNRYMYSIQGLICILAVWGSVYLYKLFPKIKKILSNQ